MRTARKVNLSNLLSTSLQLQNYSQESAPARTVKLALLSVRSLANKSFLINDLISTHDLDFLLLTETWLNEANSAVTLIESAPPNYDFLSIKKGVRFSHNIQNFNVNS